MKRSRRILKFGLGTVVLIVLALILFLSFATAVTENLDDVIYELPYASGTKHQVVQGYGGLFSHSHIAAIDFSMPVGTPIYAARSGTVYSTRDDSDEGGVADKFKSKANYIIIRHSDGSFGCYWHLRQGGVVIKKGPVATGQLIGYSGSTGQVYRPHLHFSVKRKLNYEMDSFVRTRFRTSDGILLIKNWNSYLKP